MKNILMLLVALSLFACEETGMEECPDNASCLPTEEMMEAGLDSIRTQIMEIVDAGSCDESGDCTFVGLGSKPCGGPWEYLIYASSVDTVQLISLVDAYNDLEDDINEVYGRGSDCSIALAPDSVVCESTGCVAYRDGVAYTNNRCCQ